MLVDETQALTATKLSNTPVDYAQALHNSQAFEQALKMATFLSKSSFIPQSFQNKPPDCLVALQMSGTLGTNIFETMKGLYVVHGKPAFTSQFAIAIANTRGPFKTGISYKTNGKGADLEVTAYATHKDSGEVIEATFSMKQAVAAGWAAKNKNYQILPEQMLSYKAAMMLIRKTCPEILMGMQTKEEVIDYQEKTGNEAIELMNRKLEEK